MEDVFLFDPARKRPGCVLLAVAMGANPSFANHFCPESWIVDGDIDGLRRYGPMTHDQVREIAERLGLASGVG